MLQKDMTKSLNIAVNDMFYKNTLNNSFMSLYSSSYIFNSTCWDRSRTTTTM